MNGSPRVVLDGDLPLRFVLVEATWLKAHEEVQATAVDALVRRLERDGELESPVVADEESGVILDGHHRFAALTQMGYRRIPAYLVPYGHPAILVEAWRDEPAPSKADVVATGLSGKPYPPKTTRHERVRHLPSHPTKLSALREAA